MISNFLAYLVGLLGGVAVGFQSPIAGSMGQKVGGTASSFLVHLSGMVLSGLLLIFRGGENIRSWQQLPWYAFLSGGFGLILFLTINYTLPKLGSTMMITLIIIGELMIGIIVDHFGWFGVTVRQIDLPRIVGVLLLFGGGYLISR